ncbi:hypothetical protein [Streptomyces sp. NPDC002559]
MDTTRRTILRGMAAAPVAAATSGLLVPGEAAAVSDGVTATPAERPMGLTYDAAHSALLEESIRGLHDKEKLGRIDVAGVLRGKPQHEGRNGVLPGLWPRSTRRPDRAFRWSGNDRIAKSPEWWPQGISTVYDATEQRGRDILLVSWYHGVEDHSANRGGRIAIIDLRGRTPKYWYALLVLPTRKAGGHSFEPLYGLHAGGLAWYGTKLYVTESRTGALYVFDTADMFPIKGDGANLCGKGPGGVFHAFGAPYAMPLRRVYRVDAQGRKRLKFSQVSVDRDPDRPYRSLVVNEWEPGKDHAIVARWDIGHNSPYPRMEPGAASAVSSAVYRVERGSNPKKSGLPQGYGMQGAVSIRGRLYLSVSRGERNGYYSGVRLDSRGVGTARKLWELPRTPEDLSYQGITRNTGRVWGLTEGRGQRFVFGMRVSR